MFQRAFLLIVGIVGAIGFLVWWNSLDFADPDKTDENLNKTANFIVGETIPTEIVWIEKATNAISNPILLTIVIIFVLWLFGYFFPKK